MRLPLLSRLGDGRVPYNTTQAECVRAHPLCPFLFFLLGSSPHPCRPPPLRPAHPLPHEMYFYFAPAMHLLSTGNGGKIEMIPLSRHAPGPTNTGKPVVQT